MFGDYWCAEALQPHLQFPLLKPGVHDWKNSCCHWR
nr:unnamed protein product [Callosobruchus analis]